MQGKPLCGIASGTSNIVSVHVIPACGCYTVSLSHRWGRRVQHLVWLSDHWNQMPYEWGIPKCDVFGRGVDQEIATQQQSGENTPAIGLTTVF